MPWKQSSAEDAYHQTHFLITDQSLHLSATATTKLSWMCVYMRVLKLKSRCHWYIQRAAASDSYCIHMTLCGAFAGGESGAIDESLRRRLPTLIPALRSRSSSARRDLNARYPAAAAALKAFSLSRCEFNKWEREVLRLTAAAASLVCVIHN